jgi:hypothetical protein
MEERKKRKVEKSVDCVPFSPLAVKRCDRKKNPSKDAQKDARLDPVLILLLYNCNSFHLYAQVFVK